MRVEVNNTVVIVYWGGVAVRLQMETRSQAKEFREHLEEDRSVQPYMDPNNYHNQMNEPGFLADLARAYYGFLSP